MKKNKLTKYFNFWLPVRNRPQGSLHSPRPVYYPQNAEKQLYERIQEFMETRKPYLDANYSIADLSRRMYSNRNLVSKAVNNCSGRNFKQFLNWYRIRFAAQLLKEDPRMRLDEVSKLSGFNTQPSFNSAFKRNMGEKPSEYVRRYVKGRRFLPAPSRKPEPEPTGSEFPSSPDEQN
ncbi:MAG: AraC family transcriptional regulator [Bacteroidales bacterium]|nr:AraC family transcriptional regulator [Candidatus Cryptobacteroides aphodequi]